MSSVQRFPQVSASPLNSASTLVRSAGCVATPAARHGYNQCFSSTLVFAPCAIFRVLAPASHQQAGQHAAAACSTALRDKDIFRGPLRSEGGRWGQMTDMLPVALLAKQQRYSLGNVSVSVHVLVLASDHFERERPRIAARPFSLPRKYLLLKHVRLHLQGIIAALGWHETL